MNDKYNIRPIKVLLVEDDPADIRLTREALKDNKLKIELVVLEDGAEAYSYLFRKDRYAEATLPDIIILDLNLPKKDGRELLADIKNSDDLKSIPVVILTTSKSEEDILNSYELHANCYITKPIGLEQFCNIVKAIENFWFTIVKLPAPKK